MHPSFVTDGLILMTTKSRKILVMSSYLSSTYMNIVIECDTHEEEEDD